MADIQKFVHSSLLKLPKLQHPTALHDARLRYLGLLGTQNGMHVAREHVQYATMYYETHVALPRHVLLLAVPFTS